MFVFVPKQQRRQQPWRLNMGDPRLCCSNVSCINLCLLSIFFSLCIWLAAPSAKDTLLMTFMNKIKLQNDSYEYCGSLKDQPQVEPAGEKIEPPTQWRHRPHCATGRPPKEDKSFPCLGPSLVEGNCANVWGWFLYGNGRSNHPCSPKGGAGEKALNLMQSMRRRQMEIFWNILPQTRWPLGSEKGPIYYHIRRT